MKHRRHHSRSQTTRPPVRPGAPWWAYAVLVVVSVTVGVLVYVALTHDYTALR